MRARLGSMRSGQEFTFLCVPLMAQSMDTLIPKAGGVISKREERTYGVVITAAKNEDG